MTDLARFPIIDAHHHLWDLGPGRHPWLCRPPWVHSRYGDYAAIRRNYLTADFLGDAAAFDVAGSIYVDAEWDPRDPGGEVAWVRSTMASGPLPSAMVAQAFLDADGVDEVLAAHAESGIVRGVRHKPTVTHGPHVPPPGPRGSMSDERWRRGYEQLARHGLSFDLQVSWWHLPEAARLAADFPATTLIVNHTGLPSDRSEAGLAAWKDALATVAALPNTAVKISGLGVPGMPWTAEGNRRIVEDTIELFGVERCMFASNFPVDALAADYTTIMGGFMRIVAGRPEAQQRALFHDNAVRLYRLDGHTDGGADRENGTS